MHWFYDPSASRASTALPNQEALHAKSLRIRSGETIAVTDGQGLVIQGLVKQENPLEFEVLNVDKISAPKIRFHLIQALAKNDRDEMAIQAAIELGATTITPWQAGRSIVKWDGKEAKNGLRWQQIAIEAMKQSQQAYVAEVLPVANLSNLSCKSGVKLVLDPRAETPLTNIDLSSGEVALAVGPEGGISEDEISKFESLGFKRVRLGSSVLRASTAGPAAIAAISAIAGAWN